jgi:hypothetical protein
MKKSSPLFPNYYDSKGERKLKRHLAQLQYDMNGFILDWDLNYLRDVGITDHYYSLLKNKKTNSEAIAETAKQYRISGRTVEETILGKKEQKP